MEEKTSNIFDNDLMEISEHASSDEQACLDFLLPKTEIFSSKAEEILARAERYVKSIRDNTDDIGIESFLQQYRLGTQEGITIMCLAEALLRIPDNKTANELIFDKLKSGDWEQHLGKSKSLFVNASTWGMMLTGRITSLGELPSDGVGGVIGKLVSRLGEPIIREALKHAMSVISTQFVIGTNIENALSKGNDLAEKGYLMSYDMLGESARTTSQAQLFYQSYLNSIQLIGESADKNVHILERPGISVKLSALHPKYDLLHYKSAIAELLPRLKTIVKKAMDSKISIAIDAEETFRLDLSLMIYRELIKDPDFQDYDGLGFVLQAYQKRAYYVVEYLCDLAEEHKKRIPIRLVKGAYWDSEIKRAQTLGLSTYPVFTRKSHTDVSYLACAAKILEEQEYFYPQFATHNALTVASILEVGAGKQFEFQRLYGMGESFYEQIVEKVPCRIYAPVGSHEELLPYLIRRMLENGANNSFVNLMLDDAQSLNQILKDPITKAIRNEGYTNPSTPAPTEIYPDRKAAQGLDLGNMKDVQYITQILEKYNKTIWHSSPIVSGKKITSEKHDVFCPFNSSKKIGETCSADIEHVEFAVNSAESEFTSWSSTPVATRFTIVEKIASLLESRKEEAIALCVFEAGKTVKDAISEVMETIDYCHYYASQTRKHFEIPQKLNGPTGEENTISLHGKGVFACISPWNFPMAIFSGQIIAALLAGNTVVAKPAEQTTLTATFMIDIMHEAGIPLNALHLITGSGMVLGPALTSNPKIAGVAFTGSTNVAHEINNTLASRKGPIATLIAETGGQNAMIVDSSALTEQVIDDIIISAFESTGQRCSSLRVLYIQDDVADHFINILKGALQDLIVGPTHCLSNEIGPVIGAGAKDILKRHIANMHIDGKLLGAATIDDEVDTKGFFVPPHAFEIKSMSDLTSEVFGPVLHVIRYESEDLDEVIDQINSTGYGLTFGIHSRIEHKIDYITKHIKAGNIYINRSMTGAVVGVQPFGGEGLSGTGPKAGGPNYLIRFATERTISTNTTAIGGNISLFS